MTIPDYEYRTPYVGHYAVCDACGSFFQNPMPSFEQLSRYYPTNYHAATNHGMLARLRHTSRLRALQPLLQGDGALLDYGCGNGAFLLWAAQQNLGRDLIGYEIAENDTIERLASGVITIVRGRPEYLLGVLPICRVVTMNHVIEHLPDPAATIAKLIPFLAVGGTLQGQTPATDSLERRVFGQRWSGYHSPRHTVVFSHRGLLQLFARIGLVTPKITHAFNPAAMAVSLACALRPQPTGIHRHGPAWLGWLAAATLLAPLDLLSHSGAIVNYSATRAGKQ